MPSLSGMRCGRMALTQCSRAQADCSASTELTTGSEEDQAVQEDRKKKPRFPFFAGYGRYVKPRIGPDPGECLHGSKEDATDRSGGAGGIGHSSCLPAQRPSMGVMSIPRGAP
jgi:hypothetical protein